MRYALTCAVGLFVVGCGGEVGSAGDVGGEPPLQGPAIAEDPIDDGPARPATPPSSRGPSASEDSPLPSGALRTRCTTVVDQPGGSRIATVDLDSGRTELGATVTLPDPINLSSLGARGRKLFACGGSGVVRVDMKTGAVDEAKTPCDAVSADATGIWVLDHARRGLRRYVDWAALRADAPAELAPAPDDAARVAIRGTTLVASAYSGNVVTVMESGAAPRAVGLEAFYGSIAGMDVAADGRRLLLTSSDAGYAGVMVFDMKTGAFLSSLSSTVDSPTGLHGLACETVE
ncbi:MAG: hypothetical protein KC657_28295 [Myxococcales bacterium]|nr:hypothetical protein [Myxococcales bacterium]